MNENDHDTDEEIVKVAGYYDAVDHDDCDCTSLETKMRTTPRETRQRKFDKNDDNRSYNDQFSRAVTTKETERDNPNARRYRKL